MMGFIADALAGIGSFFAGLGSVTCSFFWYDEPECPESLIK